MAEAGPSVVKSIRASTKRLDNNALQAEARQHLDAAYGDSDILHGSQHATQSSSRPSSALGKGKRKRTVKEELAYWEAKEATTAKELKETTAILPKLLEETQEQLQSFLSDAQGLSLQRYALADKLANLLAQLSSDRHDEDSEQSESGQTVLEQMQVLQAELQRLEAGLAWATVLERVLTLSERVLDARSHHPSPLAALPQFWELHDLVGRMQRTLPDGTALLRRIVEVRDETWNGLKEIMSNNLLKACEPLKWPLKTDYASLSPVQRRNFERAFQDLLYLQLEGEKLRVTNVKSPHWSSGTGLYPLQAMIGPIELRFKYHFQGSKSTNRVDKPEWAFSNILDQIYQHQAFLGEYLQPLIERAGYRGVDARFEFSMLLFPVLLNLLRSRIPPMLEHPALLAHTIYQTVIFDDAIREGGFSLDAVSVNEGIVAAPWEGLTGVLLKESDWFEQWLTAERKFADGQLHEIITSPEAWTIETDVSEEEQKIMHGLKPTASARRVKSLLEQIQDRYAPLPELEYKLPFLTKIQLPLLSSYHGRINASLEAFETLSSAFVRAVPGALANSRAGINYDQSRLTGGTSGLQRLLKALLSARWILAALKIWADDPFYVEISLEIQNTPSIRWRLQGEPLISTALHTAESAASIFDVLIERFKALTSRAEDMTVRLISVEVENDLREHMKRRWDLAASDESNQTYDASLVAGLTTFSSLLGELRILPSLDTSRVYRKVVKHLTNHISQRCVYAGWSKFSVKGGQDFIAELSDWRHAAASVLSGGAENEGIPANLVDAPWEGLMDAGKLLSLPMDAEDKQSDVTFGEAMAAAWGGEESFRGFLSRARISMSRDDLQALLRRRVECWR